VDAAVSLTGTPYAYAADDPVNAVDPDGLLSVGVCAGLTAAAPILGGGTLTGCLTRIVSGGPDAIGLTGTGGGFVGQGEDVSGSVGYEISNATNLSQLGKTFFFYTTNIDIGPGATVTVFISPNGRTYGVYIGPSFGEGFAKGPGVSYTRVLKLHGWAASFSDLIWDLQTSPGGVGGIQWNLWPYIAQALASKYHLLSNPDRGLQSASPSSPYCPTR
jgi:hypothetical protein